MRLKGERCEMTNPSDFVMYVVMVKPPNARSLTLLGHSGLIRSWSYAKGFARNGMRIEQCKTFRVRYGKKNAYVQQYGPFS